MAAGRRAAEVVLALEVDQGELAAALVGRDGAARSPRRAPIGLKVGEAAAVAAIRALARQTVAGSGAAAAGARVVGACVLVPGIVDSTAGIARYCGEFGWHNVALAALIEADIGVPVVLDHAVRASALAEAASGTADGARDWLYVSIGRGVSAAAVVDGVLQRGSRGAAGEFGHLPIYPFGQVCPCGQRGCVEAYASTTAILARYQRVSGQARDLAAIAARVGRDPLADEVIAQAVDAIGLGLAHYTLMADPAVVVLGGELTGRPEVADVALPAVREELRRRLLWRQPPKVAAARLGAPAALEGAVRLAWAALDVIG